MARPTEADRLLRFYRTLSVVGALGVVLFGWVHRAAMPTAVDPVWQRAGMAAVCLLPFAATWLGRPRTVVRLVYVAYYAMTIWVLELLYLNGMAWDYALALVVVAAGIAGTMQDLRHVIYYQAVTVGGIMIVALATPAPDVNLLVYVTYAAMAAILSYLVVGSRLELDVRRVLSEERYALAARGARDGLWDWDLRTGRITYSPRWAAMLGLDVGSVSDDPEEWLGRVHPDDVAGVRRDLDAALADVAEAGAEVRMEYRLRGEDGEWRWMQARAAVVRDETGAATRLAGSQADVTEQKRAEERLIHDTLHDRLTQLPNRVVLMDRLERLLATAERRPEFRFAVLFLDLDRFRRVNDSLGHEAGDRVLLAVAERLSAQLRQEDTLARVGGDEFVAVVPWYEDREDLLRVATRLQEAVAEPMEAEGETLHLTASIGITLAPDGYHAPGDILRDAAIAMDRSKRAHSHRPQLFDEEMHRQAVTTLRLESELRRALDESELTLHYQPIVRLETGRIEAVEALVRWRHPERGLLPPSEFLPAAEESGLIVDLGRWALREACRAHRRWRSAGLAGPAPMVHVNLSGSHFLAGSLMDDVAVALDDGGIGTRLGVEITESVLLTDPAATGTQLMALRDRGIGVAIDDFGTGYSSLRYLHSLPADALKIDRSFVQRASESAGLEVIRTIVILAQRLGMSTVAEGIETREIASSMRSGGATFGQGHLFAPALEEDDVGAALAGGAPFSRF